MDQENRFWKKVIHNENGCWEWTGGKCTKGYGYYRYNGKMTLCHRISWELNYGNIPEGLLVLHKCDNPKCVNPEHLWLGTVQDNSRDMYSKNRNHIWLNRKGASNSNSKLTQEEVDCIRSVYANKDATYEQLALYFRVSKNTISRIVNNKSWRTA